MAKVKEEFNPISAMMAIENAVLYGIPVEEALATLFANMETSEEAKIRLGVFVPVPAEDEGEE